MTDVAEPRWLSPDEERAWRAYRRMQTVLPVALARDLARDSGLSDPDYDVLSTLSEQAGHRWQLRDLAARMLWSRSRLSHHLARMETRGLVRREADADDGRNAVVVLTDHGFATLEAAAPAHVASVRRHLVDLATPDELAALAALAERVVAEVGDLS
ncbi:MarR family winged helix-turn-helix transcriptional regulator [Cellulosimicrobium protaetiae]|uniref:Winged helix-turn-helix transcriptional regulator n=1 Tax=Cellulosimicrobium protaetiae TaxID=2587808 RepID=A0A6M5UHV7_9MICO|nr:MarR family winged helix-turn-helix transcriptional regulator [Cellulosimicrobium protaetiae]QJW36718.1 winged helix-turn-helix transcriptional regulator [Cellulosimicrobium protaetiae]